MANFLSLMFVMRRCFPGGPVVLTVVQGQDYVNVKVITRQPAPKVEEQRAGVPEKDGAIAGGTMAEQPEHRTTTRQQVAP
jgi:hypothetical protein